MLKIKLARFGKQHQPHYRFVITEARDKRDGQYVVSLGHYAPTQVPKILELDLVEYDAWMKKGAQPTETVAALAEKVRSGKGFTAKKKLSKKAVAKKAAEKAAAEAPVEAAPAVETPAVEAAPTESETNTAPAETPEVEAA